MIRKRVAPDSRRDAIASPPPVRTVNGSAAFPFPALPSMMGAHAEAFGMEGDFGEGVIH